MNEPEQGVGNSYEVAVDDAVHKAQAQAGSGKPKEPTEWKVGDVIVVTGSQVTGSQVTTHIKEYRVSVVESTRPASARA